MKIIIGHRHGLMRDGLSCLFRESRPDWQLLLAADFNEVAELARQSAAALALLDSIMPGMSGTNGIRLIGSLAPEMAVIMLGDTEERGTILGCLEAGALGFVSAAATPFQLQGAVDTVLSGAVFVPACIAGSAKRNPPILLQHQFTGRQGDVFELLAEGCSTKTIARRLDLAVGTVKVHLAAIYRALGVNSRLQALARGLELARARPEQRRQLGSGIGRLPVLAGRSLVAVV